MSSRIKDVSEFCKLFRVRIPLEEEFDYYISVLTQSKEFAHLPELVEDFAAFENYLEGGSVSSFKMGILNQLKNKLSATEAFNNLREFKPGAMGTLHTEAEKHQGSFLVPVDIAEAKYSVFKCFDLRQELPATWEAFCYDQKVPEILARSKSFRQLVFGTLDPKKLQCTQQHLMELIFFAIRSNGIPSHYLLTFTSDELVFRLGLTAEESLPDYLLVEDIVDRINSGPWPDMFPEPFSGNLKLRHGIFKLHTLSKGMFVKDVYKAEDRDFSFQYKMLVGVPGNQFYIYFKKHILNQPVEDRDLYFYSDQRLAKWVVED
jgi:hypothetical protein